MKYLLLLLIATSCLLNAQSQVNIDSLEKALSKLGNDTASISSIVNTGRKYMTVNYDASLTALKIAEDKLSAKSGDKLHAIVNIKLGEANYSIGNFIESTECYLKAIPFAEKAGENLMLATIYSGLGQISVRNKENKKPLAYFEKALSYCGPNDLQKRIDITANLSSVYYGEAFRTGRFIAENKSIDTASMNKAIYYNKEAYKLGLQNNLRRQLSHIVGDLALEYAELKELDSATFYFNILEELIGDSKSPHAQLVLADRAAQLYKAKGEYARAVANNKKVIAIGEQIGDLYFVNDSYIMLALTLVESKDYKEAAYYYDLHYKLNDSLFRQDNFETANNIKNIYEKEKKEKEYLKLQASEKQKSTLNKILAGSAAGILLLSLLAYRNFKNRNKIAAQEKELQQQKIIQLEKESKLNAVDAMLKGQEEERGRIAKDLHDGLGGLLSGTKMSFNNLRENVILSEENAVKFDKSLMLLDSTINDLRKVAQNLMPEALIRYGLIDALKDFCHRMESTSSTTIAFHQIGENRVLENTAAISVYRIIQELVNNALKHADAKKILVQLGLNENSVSITVEDDGKGFDKNELAGNKGAGMENLKYRVQYLNGKMDIVTAADSGASVNVELKA